ncbi:MAG: FHA domain-containing protein [Microthrixaceae bacterium]
MEQLTVTIEGRTVPLAAPGPHVIGRHSGSAVVIDHDAVSRRHLELRVEAGRWTVADLGSANGTYVDGRPLDTMILGGPVSLTLGRPGTGAEVELTLGSGVPAELGRPLRVHSLGSARLTIGRAEDNDVVLNDLLASRHHAELTQTTAHSWHLRDLGSVNGTFLNGIRLDTTAQVAVEPADESTPGDMIGIGSRVLRIGPSGLLEFSSVEQFPVVAQDLRVVTREGVVLLNDVSFAAEPASMTAVLGPSGSGKSTLLGALTGLAPATSGRVLCGDHDLYTELSVLSRRIGYVPQDDLVQPEITVEQSLRYAARLRFAPEVPTAERETRVEEVISELGLAHRRGVHVGDLSGGQRKRVSIGLELLTRPSMVYLDEPTSGLDPGYERSVMMLLRRLADSGRTVVLVTHSVDSLHLCDRVLCLAPGGRTAWYGPPEEMLAYFGRQSFQEIFQLLDATGALDHAAAEGDQTSVDPAVLHERFESSPAAQLYVKGPLESYRQARSVEAAETARRQGGHSLRNWVSQVGTLTARYARIMSSDRRTLFVLAVTGPVLGIVLLLRLPPAQLGGDGRPLFSQAAVISFILAIGITQVATSTSAREIVKERAIFSRERTVGVPPGAYLTSKVLVLGGIAVMQAVVIIGIATARQEGPATGVVLGWGRLELFVTGSLVALGAMAAGLLLSALVNSPDRVALLLPAILGFHVLVTAGEAIPSVPRVPVLDQARYLSTARWGFAAMGATADVENRGEGARLIGEVSGMTLSDLRGVTSIEELDIDAPLSPDLEHDATAWWRDTAAVVALTVVMLGATAMGLRRRRPTA